MTGTPAPLPATATDRIAGASPEPQTLRIRCPSNEEAAAKERWRRVLEEDRTRLLLHHPFTASLALQLDVIPVVDSRLRSAATDGRRIFAHIGFLAALSPDARLFVLAHEVWHCVAGHFVRRFDRDPHAWNLAADHEVNALLQRDGLAMPGDAVYFGWLDGESAEAVYDWLHGTDAPPTAGMVQFDDHAPGGAAFGRPASGDAPMSADAAQVQDPDFTPQAGGEALKRDWQERLATAVNRSKGRGNLPERLECLVDSLLRPSLPWRTLLQRFVQRTYGGARSWHPPSRRHIYRKLWLPGMRGQLLRVMVAIDTSGSTSEVLPRFMSEVRGLVGEFDRIEITLVECDAEISRVRTLSATDDVDGPEFMSILGGGGTDLRPPFELAAKDPPACLVYLTDGFGPIPESPPGFPVLWVMPDDESDPPPWGEIAIIAA